MIRDEIIEVLSLQPDFSAENTPEMKRRGEVIRRDIRHALRDNAPALNAALNRTYQGDLSFEGRDGTGRKTRIPWHRVYVEDLSPSAQEGWYVVYLFKADGSGVYLCLSHGSTKFDGMSFNPRPDNEMASLVSFAREILSEQMDGDRLELDIDLADNGSLGKAYPKSTAFGLYYPADAIPSDETLQLDLEQFIEWLGQIYTAVELGYAPESVSPEKRDLQSAISPLKGRGQGRGLSGPERRAVELHAMDVTRTHLKALGYTVSDDSARQSYDFKAVKGDETILVEVKGTTGGASTVLMTINEVELHNREHPKNALSIVHDVTLTRGDQPEASGGTLVYIQPWQVDQKALRPTAFEVSIPSQLLEDKKVTR
jgi:MrcB-like, N-terminal domain/Protein NO VEIN, C-terminal